MTKKQQKKMVVINPDKEHQKYLRQKLRKAVASLQNADNGETTYKRQLIDVLDDPFSTEIYKSYELIQPPISFTYLYQRYEESDVLQECVDTMQQNIDGFGYQLHFLGDDIEERDTDEAVRQHTKASNFFDYANEKESWIKIRKLMRQDLEAIGNGGFEVIRNKRNEVQMIYHIPFQTIRLTKLDEKPIKVPVSIMRNGKPVEIILQKYFRRFVQIKNTGEKARWFKSFGDPRIVDALTGEYITDEKGNLLAGKKKPKMSASEIIHFKLDSGGRVYGVPRWLGAVPDVCGRRKAQFVNYDLFDSQGIPPMAIMVSGGVLTDESVEEVEALVEGMRGAEQWNKIVLLESNMESTGLEDKGTAKIELKNLTEYRKDDQMFEKYLRNTEQSIRHTYRIPDLYVGKTESFTHATSKAARLVAEEQVFIPARNDIDEFINTEIIKKELRITFWQYKTKGPKIVGADEMSKGVETLSKAGAFTINHAVEMANQAFGLQMSKFSEEWANYPVPIVLKMVELGTLSIKALSNSSQETVTAVQENIEKMEDVTNKILESELFNKEEKDLYKRLLTIHNAIASKKE